LLLEEEETRGQRGVAGLCFFEEKTMERKKKRREATVLVCLPSLLVFGG
jgi:hypothetical protein